MSTDRKVIIIKKGDTVSGRYSKKEPCLKQIMAQPFLPIRSIARVNGVCTATIANTTIAKTGLVNGGKTYISQCKSNETFNIKGNTPIVISNVTQAGADVTFQYTQTNYINTVDNNYDATINNFTNPIDVGICAFGGVVRGSGGTQFVNNEAATPVEHTIITHTVGVVSGSAVGNIAVGENIGTIVIAGDYTDLLIAGQKIYTSGDAIAGYNSITTTDPNGYFVVNTSSYSAPNTTITYAAQYNSLGTSSGTRKLRTTLESKDSLGMGIMTVYDAGFGEYTPKYDFIDPATGRNTLAFTRVFGNVDTDKGSVTSYAETDSQPIDDMFSISIERKQDVDLLITLDFSDC